MKKIKILEAIRQGKVGGGETHVLELSTHLDLDRFEPIVLSFTPGPMIDELNRQGIKTKVIYTEKGFDFTVWKQVSKFIEDEGIDIVHAHGTRAASNVFWAAKHTGRPLVYTVHGWSFHLDQSFPIRKMRELSEKFITSQADKTICVSVSNEHDGIERFGMKRSTVIYNAVDLHKFDTSNAQKDVRAELGIAEDKIVIGYIVRITGQKDPFTMLRAMKIVAQAAENVVLLMVGDGDLKEQAIQLTQELGIQDRVVFQHFRSDIPDVLKAIDIYCLPSLWEGFPIGILEAMAMNRVVVASPVDGNRELVENEKTGLLVEHGNPEALASKLLLLVKNPEMRHTLAFNAHEYVVSHFGINRLVDDVQKEYVQLVS